MKLHLENITETLKKQWKSSEETMTKTILEMWKVRPVYAVMMHLNIQKPLLAGETPHLEHPEDNVTINWSDVLTRCSNCGESGLNKAVLSVGFVDLEKNDVLSVCPTLYSDLGCFGVFPLCWSTRRFRLWTWTAAASFPWATCGRPRRRNSVEFPQRGQVSYHRKTMGKP